MDRPIKWILVNNEIRLSNCLFHRDLINDKYDRYFEVKGGGIIEVDDNNKLIIFKGKSEEFGSVNKEDFNNALKENIEEIYRTLWMVMAMRDRDNKEKEYNDYKITFIN